MYIAYMVMQTVSIVAAIILFVVIARARPTRIQGRCFALMSAYIIYSLAFFIELNTSEISVLAVCCKLEYFGLCVLTVTNMWFCSEFCRLRIPAWVYIFCAVMSVFIVGLLFTIEFHSLMYEKMEMVYNGYFYQCKMTHGPLYWVPYAFFTLTNGALIVSCATHYSRYKGVDRKRVALVLIGLSLPLLATLAHSLELFGNLDVLGLGLFGAVLCFSLTIIRYNYFDSVQAATDNVINYGSEGLVVISLDGEVLFANRRAREIFPRVRVSHNASDDPALMHALEQGGGEVSAGEFIYSVRVEDICEGERMQARMVWLIDMTQYYLYTNELKRISELAEKANSFKSAFLSNMSHEIRTPMNAILGMNEMILRESSEKGVQEYANNIDRAGRALLSIINDVLDISKIEAGKLEFHYARYEISALLNDVINMSYQQAHDKGLYYKVEVDPDIPHLLIGDEARIRQVLLNLVSNATKYTREGGFTLKASYQGTDDARRIMLVFTITDTGVGIREEDLPQLFKDFQRLDLAANHAIQGTGLGLSITKQLVEKMGGYVLVESIFGEGSIFTVVIPNTVESFHPIGLFSQVMHSSSTGKRKEHIETFTAPDAHILVIDDNEMNLMVVRGLLRGTKVQLDEAVSGQEGIELTQKNHYDLVLLDHMMPGLNGVDTLRIMREKGLAENIPVIALTANALTGARESYIKAGFIDYIPKPIDPSKLERSIASYLPSSLVHYTLKQDEERSVSDIHIEGVDVPSGVYYVGGSLESYNDLLSAYVRVTSANLEKLEAYAFAGDLANYQILVHSLKSTSAGVGAGALAAHAAQHEQKSAEGDDEFIRQDLGKLLQEARGLLAAMNRYLSQRKPSGEESAPAPIKADDAKLKEMLEAAYERLMAFDSEGEGALREILQVELDEKQRAAVQKALSLAEDYEYYQSADAIKELLV